MLNSNTFIQCKTLSINIFFNCTLVCWKILLTVTVSNMETALLLGSLLLQVRSIICDPTWSKSDPSWKPVSIFESVILYSWKKLWSGNKYWLNLWKRTFKIYWAVRRVNAKKLNSQMPVDTTSNKRNCS